MTYTQTSQPLLYFCPITLLFKIPTFWICAYVLYSHVQPSTLNVCGCGFCRFFWRLKSGGNYVNICELFGWIIQSGVSLLCSIQIVRICSKSFCMFSCFCSPFSWRTWSTSCMMPLLQGFSLIWVQATMWTCALSLKLEWNTCKVMTSPVHRENGKPWSYLSSFIIQSRFEWMSWS